jgi:hypothetical protein
MCKRYVFYVFIDSRKVGWDAGCGRRVNNGHGWWRQGTTRLGKLGSAAVANLRSLTFGLLLSLTHAGERHQPKCSRKLPFRGSCQKPTFSTRLALPTPVTWVLCSLPCTYASTKLACPKRCYFELTNQTAAYSCSREWTGLPGEPLRDAKILLRLRSCAKLDVTHSWLPTSGFLDFPIVRSSSNRSLLPFLPSINVVLLLSTLLRSSLYSPRSSLHHHWLLLQTNLISNLNLG